MFSISVPYFYPKKVHQKMFEKEDQNSQSNIMNDGNLQTLEIETRNIKKDKNFKISSFLFDKIKRWGMIHMSPSRQMYFRGGNLGSEFIG